MKAYTVLYAEDVPHYGTREFEVADDTLLKALEDAFVLLDRISDTLHYEDGLPVTFLKPVISKSSTGMPSPSLHVSKR
jgi:hypothetical protein